MTFCDETPETDLPGPPRWRKRNGQKNKSVQIWEGRVRTLHDRLEAGLVAAGGTTRHRDDTTLDYAGAGVPKDDGSVFRGTEREKKQGGKVL